MKTRHWQDWLTALIGIWTFVSPWVLAHYLPGVAITASVAWSFHLVGLAIAIVGIGAILAYRLWEEWVDVILGAWLFASPTILRFGDIAGLRWNAMIMGALVVILAAWVLLGESRPQRPERPA
jgi:SPW repeat